jgi:tetratricopeptide (TPR) repeat protein
MAGNIDVARALIDEDRAILRDLGLRVTEGSAAGLYGSVMMLADDPAAAERELRRGCEIFEQMGDPISFSTNAANLAEAIYAQGRYDEALEWTERAEGTGQEEDLHTQIPWRGTRAKVLARRGEADEAVALAREAVAIAMRTDFLSLHGDALLNLADTLELAGRQAESRAAAAEALALYERKENVVGAARACARSE